MLIAGLVAFGCTSPAPVAAPPPPHVDELASRLAGCKLTELATGLSMDPQVSDVWKAFPDATSYIALVEDAKRPTQVRFAAALMLRSASAVQFHQADAATMAQVFADALRDDLAGYSFPWGWLWAPGDSLGALGTVFPELGTAAQPALFALLDDDSARDIYLGSDESAAMAQRHYRVKDFAAFYLAKIANLDFPWEPEVARRDVAIARMRRQLTGGRSVEPITTTVVERPNPPRVGGARVRATHDCQAHGATEGDAPCRRRTLERVAPSVTGSASGAAGVRQALP